MGGVNKEYSLGITILIMLHCRESGELCRLSRFKYDKENPSIKERLSKVQGKLNILINEKLVNINLFSEEKLKEINDEENKLKQELKSINEKVLDIQSLIMSQFSSKPVNELHKELEEKKLQYSDLDFKYKKLLSQEKENGR